MFMMPNCKETSRLVSASMDRRLPFLKRLMLRLHLRMCKYCRRFEQQLLRMREISRHLDHHIETLDSAIGLSEDARKRMRNALRSQSGSH